MIHFVGRQNWTVRHWILA